MEFALQTDGGIIAREDYYKHRVILHTTNKHKSDTKTDLSTGTAFNNDLKIC